MSNSELTYNAAMEELESIVSKIENEEIDVDALADKVKRASQLSKLCNTKLKNTEDEVKKILAEMEKSAETIKDTKDTTEDITDIEPF